MEFLGYILLVVALLAGLYINLLALPGLWLMVVSASVYAWATDWRYIGLKTLVVLVGLGLIAEGVEFVAGSAGAKRAGGSRRALAGAIVGGLLGAVFFSFTIPVPVLGTIIGTVVGVVAGTFGGATAGHYWARGNSANALRVGWAAARGRFWGTIYKLCIGGAMLLISLWSGLPIGGTPPVNNPKVDPPPTSKPVAMLWIQTLN